MSQPVYLLKKSHKALIIAVLEKYKFEEGDFTLSSEGPAHTFTLKPEPRFYFVFQQHANNLEKFTNRCTLFTPQFSVQDFRAAGGTIQNVRIAEAVDRFEKWLVSDVIPYLNETSDFLEKRGAGEDLSQEEEQEVEIPSQQQAALAPVQALSIYDDDVNLTRAGLYNVGLLGYISELAIPDTAPLEAIQITFDNGKIDNLYTANREKEKLSKRNPKELGIIGFVHLREGTQTLRVKRLFNRETFDHVYITNYVRFADEKKYIDESGDHPIFLLRKRVPQSVPLYLYSNTSHKFQPAHHGDTVFSTDSDVEFTKDERVEELWKLIDMRGLDRSAFSIPRLDEDSITVLMRDGLENFYVNLQENKENFTVRINPARANGDYIFNNVTKWKPVMEYFGEWLNLIDGSANGSPIRDLNEATGVKFLEGGSRFSFRNEKVKAALNVETQAGIFFNLLESIPSSENGLLLGIFGKWGRGKTFFWEKLKEIFSARCKEIDALKLKSKVKDRPPVTYDHVEFHAWKYQDTHATWAYLYEVCAKKFYERKVKIPFSRWNIRWQGLNRFINRFYLNILRVGRLKLIFGILGLIYGFIWYFVLKLEFKKSLIANLVAFIGVGTLISGFLYYYFYSGTAKRLIRQYFSEPSYQHLLGVQAEIQKELRSLFGVWISEKNLNTRRVVLFVDDIDRCNEDRIIQVIDALKVMMDDPFISQRVIVIAAVDETVLKRAIKLKYHEMVVRDLSLDPDLKTATLESLCREYMDKLFLNGFRLGALSSDDKIEIVKTITVDRIFFRNDDRKEEHFKLDSDSENDSEEKEKNQDEVVEDENVDENRQEAVKPKRTASSDKYITMLPKDNFEIMDWELKYLIDAVAQFEQATPRAIRIFYYRYLLAKHFKDNIIRENTAIYNEWRLYDSKEILCFMIVDYSSNKGQRELLKELLVPVTNAEIKKVYLQKEFALSGQLHKALLKVVEIVVPY